MNHITSELRQKLEEAKAPISVTREEVALCADIHNHHLIQACFTIHFLNGVLDPIPSADDYGTCDVEEVVRFITALSHEAGWEVVEELNKKEIPKGFKRMWHLSQRQKESYVAVCQGQTPRNQEGACNDVIHVIARLPTTTTHKAYNEETGRLETDDYDFIEGDFLFPNTLEKALSFIQFLRFFINV